MTNITVQKGKQNVLDLRSRHHTGKCAQFDRWRTKKRNHDHAGGSPIQCFDLI